MNAFKESAISCTFVGWTEDWEKEKWKIDGALNKFLFSTCIKTYTLFCLILVKCITYAKKILYSIDAMGVSFILSVNARC